MFSRIPGLQSESRWTRLPSVMEKSPLIRAPLSLHPWWQQERVLKSPPKSTHRLQHVSICESGAGCCHCSACWVSVWWWWWWAQSPLARLSGSWEWMRAPSVLGGSWRVREGEVLQVKRPKSLLLPFIKTKRNHTHSAFKQNPCCGFANSYFSNMQIMHPLCWG